MRVRRVLTLLVAAAVAAFALIQLVPYGRAHANPSVLATPRWDSPRTARLVAAACGDCHSFRTTWPWYSNVAPVSWLVYRDVQGGRGALNFSNWRAPQPSLSEVVDQVAGGSMPPFQYTIMHPRARLSAGEKRALIAGLRATWRRDPPPVRQGGG